MKQKIWPLLIVALLALGAFSIIGFQGEASGDFAGPRLPPKVVKPVIIDRGPERVVVDNQPDTVVYETDDSYQDNILLTCHVFQYEHPGVAPPNVARICAAYGVNL